MASLDAQALPSAPEPVRTHARVTCTDTLIPSSIFQPLHLFLDFQGDQHNERVVSLQAVPADVPIDSGLDEYEIHLGGDTGPVSALQRAAANANGNVETMLRSQRPQQVSEEFGLENDSGYNFALEHQSRKHPRERQPARLLTCRTTLTCVWVLACTCTLTRTSSTDSICPILSPHTDTRIVGQWWCGCECSKC